MKERNRFLYYSLLVGGLAILVSFIRAYKTGIAYDEAFTYMYYTSRNPLYVLTFIFKNGTLANNHLLNSFCISIMNLIFGMRYNEFIIRFPNLMFYLLYFIFCYKLSLLYKNKYFVFTFLMMNYGLNEYCGMARGYGMAAALVLVGIYYYKNYLKTLKDEDIIKSFYLILLGCYANTVTLLIFASVLIISFIIIILNKDLFRFIKKNWIHLIIGCILTLIIIKYHFMISQDGLPLFGAGLSIDAFTTYLKMYGINEFSVIVFWFLIMVIVYIFINKYKESMSKKRRKSLDVVISNNGTIIFIMYFLLSVGLPVITHKFLLVERLVVPSMPLITYCIVESLDSKKLNINYFAILFIMIFLNNVTILYTRDVKDHYDIKGYCLNAYVHNDYYLIPENKRMHLSTFFYEAKFKNKYGFEFKK